MPQWTLAQTTFRVKDILGDKIGHGRYREVFNYLPNENFVVKKIRKRIDCQHENITEYTNWRNLREISVISELLAPVEDISVCGRYLLMIKTMPIRDINIGYLPKFVPIGYCDAHARQLSFLNRKIIIHDYGCNILKPKLRRVDPKFWEN